MSLVVLEQLMCCQYVAIRARENLGIVRVAYLQGIFVNLLIHGAATLHNALVITVQLIESVEDIHLATMCPVGLVALVHILDILNLVVANQRERCLWLLVNLTKVMNIGQYWGVVLLVSSHLLLTAVQVALGHKAVDNVVVAVE